MRNPISQTEQDYIVGNIEKLSIKKISKTLGRSTVTIGKYAHTIGLSAIIEAKKQNARFVKGHCPKNKGLKQTEYMTAETIERTKATRFQKGKKSANALADGTETLRADKRGRLYTLVKLPGAKTLKAKHIHVWETHHNTKAPKGSNVVFKDGDTQNCTIENLECITDCELMQRNTIHRYPQEIKELLVIKASINRKITHYKKTQV